MGDLSRVDRQALDIRQVTMLAGRQGAARFASWRCVSGRQNELRGAPAEARGAAVTQKVEDQAEALAVAVDEDRAVLGVAFKHVEARAEHGREHRPGHFGQRGARGIVPHAADVEPEAVLA